MTVHIEPGLTDSLNEGCCIPHVGAYLVGPGFWSSSFANNSVMRRAWGGLFATSGMNSSNANGIGFDPVYDLTYFLGNAGFITRPDENGICADVSIASPWHRLTSPLFEIDEARDLSSKHIIVYDILGRGVLKVPNSNPDLTKENIETHVRQQLKFSNIRGNEILLIHYVNKNGINENIKIFY